MKKLFFTLFLSAFVCVAQSRITEVVMVVPEDIQNGWVIKRFPLTTFALPDISITDVIYQTNPIAALSEGFQARPAAAFTAEIGRERKMPFVVVRIPAYNATASGSFVAVRSFTVSFTENAAAPIAAPSAAKTTASNTPLASGKWYKISVPAEGVYKVTRDFLGALGISGSVATSAIRVYGNSGRMLAESNAVARPSDLRENALDIYDGGDGNFDGGDYFLFYATGPTAWVKDSINQRFSPLKHLYADSSYYFVSVDAPSGEGVRIAQQGAAPTPDAWATSYNYRAYHEQEEENPGKFGKNWLGDVMTGSTLTRNVSFAPGNVTDKIFLNIITAARSFTDGSSMNVSANGSLLSTHYYAKVSANEGENPLSVVTKNHELAATNNVSIDFAFTAGSYDAKAYIDRIILNTRAALKYSGVPLSFRDWSSTGPGKTAGYRIEGSNSSTRVWDVTDPQNALQMNGTLAGSTYSISGDASALHEYIVFDPAVTSTPSFSGVVENQNLHGLSNVDLVIVTAPQFATAAARLAAHHEAKNGISVAVVTTTQVYNEFSSGAQDIAAIRDFMKMLYDDAGTDTSAMPRNLLLFGDASYDYKMRISGNTNFVPSFQSLESVNFTSSYVSDDFFGLLDDNEYIESGLITLDIGVSRIPVGTPEEAEKLVDKIIQYSSSASLGPWKTANTYIGDNIDGAGDHLSDAEDMAQVINGSSNFFTDSKIYLDNLPFVSTPAGVRCPDGTKALNDAIFKGTFLINYSGHGNTSALANERILTSDEFNNWDNLDKLPFMITATCDFSRFDNPTITSAGERLILKADGGAIAMLTTTHLVYAGANNLLNQAFLRKQFSRRADGEWNTFGDAYREAKNQLYLSPGGSFNTKQFVLLGDGALLPAFPEHIVSTDSLTDIVTGMATDSLKALGGYALSGHITDESGALLSDFNGKVYVSVLDKPRSITTDLKLYPGATRTFKVQDNIIYKGIATVTGGKFSLQFIAPADLNYDFGAGRIIYYAENGVTDAAGADTGTTIGGYSDHPFLDNAPPLVKPYIGDSLFRSGSITGSNTLLYVTIFDETGINATGTSVGHDLVAILDGDESNPYMLNDYYQTAANSYQYGIVQFPVENLADGPHTFTVKAWDVNNNSGTGNIDFVVVNGEVLQIDQLMNYPNPFTEETHFVFKHNHPNEDFKAQLAIYDVNGRLVTIMEQDFSSATSQSREMVWNGTDHNGVRLSSGVYPYRMILTTEKGIQASAYQKLVIIR